MCVATLAVLGCGTHSTYLNKILLDVHSLATTPIVTVLRLSRISLTSFRPPSHFLPSSCVNVDLPFVRCLLCTHIHFVRQTGGFVRLLYPQTHRGYSSTFFWWEYWSPLFWGCCLSDGGNRNDCVYEFVIFLFWRLRGFVEIFGNLRLIVMIQHNNTLCPYHICKYTPLYTDEIVSVPQMAEIFGIQQV